MGNQEIKESVCPRCKKVSQLFYNFKKEAICKDCLNFELTKANVGERGILYYG